MSRKLRIPYDVKEVGDGKRLSVRCRNSKIIYKCLSSLVLSSSEFTTKKERRLTLVSRLNVDGPQRSSNKNSVSYGLSVRHRETTVVRLRSWSVAVTITESPKPHRMVPLGPWPHLR